MSRFQFSMRSLLVATMLCAFAVRFWTWRQQDAPDPKWREMFFEGNEPLANTPKITLTSSVGSAQCVTVKNVGNTVLQYNARGSQHAQVFKEVYACGKWTQASWDWCGTGMEGFEIAPNSSANLVVDFWDDQKRERVLAYFSEKGTTRAGLVVLATEAEN